MYKTFANEMIVLCEEKDGPGTIAGLIIAATNASTKIIGAVLSHILKMLKNNCIFV